MASLIALLFAPPRLGRAPAPDRWQLPPGSARTIALPAGARLAVTHGRVWITEPLDPDDHFVDAGRVHRVRRGGRVVVQSEGLAPAVLHRLG